LKKAWQKLFDLPMFYLDPGAQQTIASASYRLTLKD
jgi:hypothetical protein